MENIDIKFCPNCGNTKMKRWENLTGEEKLLVEKLPPFADFSDEQRKRHLFCGRCFYEQTEQNAKIIC